MIVAAEMGVEMGVGVEVNGVRVPEGDATAKAVVKATRLYKHTTTAMQQDPFHSRHF